MTLYKVTFPGLQAGVTASFPGLQAGVTASISGLQAGVTDFVLTIIRYMKYCV